MNALYDSQVNYLHSLFNLNFYSKLIGCGTTTIIIVVIINNNINTIVVSIFLFYCRGIVCQSMI